MNTRYIASTVINDVVSGRSLSDCLPKAIAQVSDGRDAAFIQAVCYGVCRFYTRLDVILSHLLEKPMKAKDGDVHALLLVGLYQLTDMRVPPHAAVAETVNATEKLKKTWSRGFVNAILREFLRNREEIENLLLEDGEAHFAHPGWWIEAAETAWPNAWESILEANNNHPPLSLRINQRHLSRDEYISLLASKDIAARIISETENGITLVNATDVEKLPGFANGDLSVQDGAAQLAAELLKLEPGLRVLDACAAPGGKLTHILEIEPKLEAVIAVDNDSGRMESIKENLKRLHLSAECICADVADISNWWDGQLFDRILLDAPCSASGVVRRHPDIKLLREPTDIPAFADEQLHLLRSLWALLKSGGVLVYATCSIFPEENVNVIKEFLAEQEDAKEEVIVADWGIACEFGRQILPGMHQMDGFYYAKIIKT